MIRGLDLKRDRKLIRTAYGWAREFPLWFRQMDSTYGANDFERYLKACQGRAEIGIFDPQFVGMFTVCTQTPNVWECHISLRRGTDAELLVNSGLALKDKLKSMGAKEIFAYVASRNWPLRRACEAMGLFWRGAELIKGSYHGRAIHWLKMEAV